MCGFTGFYNISELDNSSSSKKLFTYIQTRGPDQQEVRSYDDITFYLVDYQSLIYQIRNAAHEVL